MQTSAILFGALVLLANPAALAREHGLPRDTGEISAIIIHTVGGPACIENVVQYLPVQRREDDASFWQRILRSAPIADAHFVVGRSGSIASVIPPAQIANHTVGANENSIGIEIVNRGDGLDPFEEDQILQLIDLIKDLRKKYPEISFNNIAGHSDIDQRTCTCAKVVYNRRQDPGINFPWERVKAAIRLPTDNGDRLSTLPRLIGKAPAGECTTRHRNKQ